MKPKCLIAILVLLALTLPAAPAQAGGVVSVCDESHLKSALAGGGTVTFSCSGTITLTSTITISTNTAIDGTGQTVTISGNSAVRVFVLNSGVTFSLKGLTVANGYVDLYDTNPYGAGIFSLGGTVIVDNSTFHNNYTFYGAAVYSSNGAVRVSNSSFTGNYTYSKGSDGAGSGIYMAGGTLEVENSTFSGNENNGAGGAINISGATATVTNSTFSDNQGGEGGAINNTSGALTVVSSSFSGNLAWLTGGGIHTSGGTVDVTSSTFAGNTAWYQDGGGFGGGIYAMGGQHTVSNSTFSGNTAELFGGGIASLGNGSFVVTNSTFAGNSAKKGGASLHNGGTLVLKNTIVANGSGSAQCNGPIVDGGGNLSYPDTTCPGSHLDPLLGPLGSYGGPTQTVLPGIGSPAIDAADDAVCAAPPINNVDQRGFTRPQGAHCDIGAVEYRQEDPGGVVDVCDEQHLLAGLSGGGTATFNCSGTINLTAGIVISANTALDASGQAVTINGGRRYRVFTVNQGITLSLNGLTVAGGLSPGPYGGGVSVINGTLSVSNSTFFENGATHAGGAIYSKGSQVTVSSSTFSGNWSDYDGGAIYSDGGGPLAVSNSTFYDNTAGNLGGAIYNLGTPSVTVSNSTFFANRAWSGWCVYNDGAGSVTLQNTIVADTAEGPECRGSTDGGGNLSYPEWSCGGIHTDPLLGALQNNGGPTQTMALGAGSPAIDAGNSTSCQSAQLNNRDQRGYARFVDGNGDTVAQCDIGAFEYGASGPPTAVLDEEPPVTAIEVSPAAPDGANGWYRSPVTVTPQANDVSPVIDLRCALDPADPPAGFDDLPEEICPFLGGAQVTAEGRHILYAAAADIWGNKSAPVSASFKIDMPPLGLTNLAMTVNREQAYAGAILEYKLMVRNLTGAAQSFTVTDPIPANTEIVRRIHYNPATNAVEWSGIVEPWGFKTFTVYVRILSGTPGGAAIVNTATLEDEPGAGSASATTIVKTLPPYRGHRADVDVNEVVIRGK